MNLRHRPILVILAAQILLLQAAIWAAVPLDTPERQRREESYFALNGTKMFHIPEKIQGPVRQRIGWMKELGVEWDRTDLWWHEIERQPGQFDFSRSDLCMDEFEKHGIQWYPIFCYGAAWFKGEHTGPSNRKQFEDFANYVGKTVERYRNRVTYWSIWNEPNIPNFWAPEPNPEHYAELLKAASKAARAADPKCKICAPAIAPLSGWDRKFVERLYQLGCKSSFDVFDYHYYRNGAPENDVPAEIDEIRAVMSHYGDSKPIWISETGVSSASLDPQDAPELQASLVVRNQLLCLAKGVKKIFYFDLQNWFDDKPDVWDSQLGLVTAAGIKKPSFDAYKTMIQEVDHKQFVGLFHPWGLGSNGVLIYDPVSKSYTLAAWLERKNDRREVQVYCDPSTDTTVVDCFGAKQVFPRAQTKSAAPVPRPLKLQLDRLPRYVHNVSASTYLTPAGVRFDQEHIILTEGEEESLGVYLHPLLNNTYCKVMKVTAPKGVRWDAETGRLTCTKDAAPGKQKIKAEISVAQPPVKSLTSNESFPVNPIQIECQAVVEVVPRISVTLRPYLDRDQFMVEASVTNQSSKETSGSFQLYETTRQRSQMIAQCPLTPSPNSVRLIGQTRRSQFPIANQKVQSYDKPVSWKMMFDKRESKAFKILPVYPAVQPPVIDGDLKDWSAQLPAAAIDDASQVTRESSEWRARSASANVRLQYTSYTLYLAAVVQDEHPLYNNNKPSEMWKGDSLELFIGMRGPTRRTVIAKEYECQIGLAGSLNGGGPAAILFHKDLILKNTKIVSQKNDRGYQIEAAVDLREAGLVGLPLSEGMMLAFDVALDDLDPGDWAPAGNDAGRALAWNGGPLNWIDPSGWGMIVLKKAAK